MKAYSMDFRECVLGDCDAGIETRQVAVKYRVSESWIRRLKQRRRETGKVSPQKPRAAEPKWRPQAERLKPLVAEQPDATLAELKQRLGLPPLPSPDANGRFPAIEYTRISLARNLIRDRKAVGLSQERLAELAGIRQETISRLESGKHTASPSTIAKIDRVITAARKRMSKAKGK